MDAVVMNDGRLSVDVLTEPEPGPGQVTAAVLACGICGSDLHTLDHTDEFAAMSATAATITEFPTEVFDPSAGVVMGHEFCARVLEVGDNVGNCKPDDVVVSIPIVMDAAGIHPVGYSSAYPGGYSEQIVLSDMLCMKVPNGLDPRHAALTEPMAVGLHAVEMSRVTPRHDAVVIGAGPVGLAIMAALRLAGVEIIVAADPSSARRDLATTMGASHVVDPGDESAVDAWRRVAGRHDLVVFEAVGIPGMIDSATNAAPRGSQIVVAGVCMQSDTFHPMAAVVRELNYQFVLGYDPEQFGRTLRRISEGEIDVRPMITGSVPLAGVADAFEDLRDPQRHAKILVIP
jgi:2-desacetyl-2-hydroxyethyl bacteriochlorophyllide A dehydrogenase